jgi:hypothetical protein
MGIEDEKTRPALRAVKRKPVASVADVATRSVKAVKRVTVLPEQRLVAPYRVQVLPRGELINGAGEADNGWLVRDDEGAECLRFVLSSEGLGATVLRALAGGKYFFDTMDGEHNRGGLVLDQVEAEGFDGAPPLEGAGHLFDAKGGRRAGFVVRTHYEVICLDAASKVVFESKPTEDGARVMARKRTVATVVKLSADGLVMSRHGGLEVTFEKSALPFERLAIVAGMTLCEAWLLERKRVAPRGHRRGVTLDLGKLLFGGD